jgi:hypothetical protein
MKRLPILTLLAGFMISRCALGMDPANQETITQINTLAVIIANKAAAAPLARKKAESSIESTTSPAKKLNAMLQVVESKKFTDTTNKQLFIQQINQLYLKVAPPLAKSAPVRPDYTTESPGVTTIDIDPALLTYRPATNTANAPAPTTTEDTAHGRVIITDDTDNEVASGTRSTSVAKETVNADRSNSEKTKFSAMGIVRSPVFIGLVGLSALAALTYAYFKKAQKTKRAKNLGTDLDEDSTEDILLA